MGTATVTETYRWRVGARVGGRVAAETAASVFQELADQDGAVEPARVLEVATPPASPLHPAFEWNDESAADQYRLIQAGQLIRSLVIVRQAADGAFAAPVRAYVRVRALAARDGEEDELDPEITARGRYIPIGRVMEEAPLRERLLQRAADELASWRQRYAELTEFASLFETIDEAVPTRQARRGQARTG